MGHVMIFQPDAPATYRTQAVQCLRQFGTPGSYQPGQPDDFPGAHFETEIEKALAGQIVHPQYRKVLRLGTAVARQRQPQFLGFAQTAFTAHRRHGMDEFTVVKLRGLAAQHHRAVTHH